MAKRAARFPNGISPASFVLDVSVAVTWVAHRFSTDYSLAILRAFGHTTALVPGNWLTDLASVVHSAERAGWFTSEEADGHFIDANRYPILIDTHNHRHAWGAILQLARTHDLELTQASALELAVRTRLPLAALDTRLRAAATRAGVVLFAP